MERDVLERGVLLLDKPEELTSMQCVEVSKRMLGARKAGHSGTLDPRVTGLMLIAFNEATKAMPVLMGLDKCYEGIMRMHGPFRNEELANAAKGFIGVITQKPPRRSAVLRKPRKREVSSFELVSIDGRDVTFRTTCEAGTYIRKLCHDIGESLGTGAHMASLRRIGIGPFSIGDAVTMEQLESQGKSCLFPLEDALERIGLPSAAITGESIRKLRNGIPLDLTEVEPGPPCGKMTGIYDSRKILIALAKSDGRLVKTERVFN
jgi:H/ACA ribonucleoprotein complex subunit 4